MWLGMEQAYDLNVSIQHTGTMQNRWRHYRVLKKLVELFERRRQEVSHGSQLESHQWTHFSGKENLQPLLRKATYGG